MRERRERLEGKIEGMREMVREKRVRENSVRRERERREKSSRFQNA